MAGLGVLTLSGFSIGYGEALIFVAAMIYALHIVGLGAWSDARQALGMAIVQLIVITVICTVCTAPNGIVLPDRAGDWVSVLYMAIFAGAGAMIGQTWAQAHLPPTPGALNRGIDAGNLQLAPEQRDQRKKTSRRGILRISLCSWRSVTL